MNDSFHPVAIRIRDDKTRKESHDAKLDDQLYNL